MKVIRILLVEHQPAIRCGLRMRLNLEPDVTVVGEAGDGLNALALAARLLPDVILMEVEDLGMDSGRLIEAMRRSAPGAVVIILSFHDDRATRARAFAAGASAFVSKHTVSDHLLEDIRQAVATAAAASRSEDGRSEGAAARNDNASRDAKDPSHMTVLRTREGQGSSAGHQPA
jgi:DNA-binding NarL/FixJ family response regulator